MGPGVAFCLSVAAYAVCHSGLLASVVSSALGPE